MAKSHSNINYPGQRFGRLVLSYPLAPGTRGRKRWRCQCECGRNTSVYEANLRNGHTKSCGCLRYIDQWHIGQRQEDFPEYQIWANIKTRTLNHKSARFFDYGGRGIRICLHWCSAFQNFLSDLGSRPSTKHSLDRRDNNGHYSCGHCEECVANGWTMNCYWATPEEQQNNKRTSRFLTFQGETLTIAQWARMPWVQAIGLSRPTLKSRIRQGWSDERALSEPVKQKSYRKITFQRRSLTISQWAKEIGMGYTAMKKRIEKWPLKRALTLAPQEQFRR